MNKVSFFFFNILNHIYGYINFNVGMLFGNHKLYLKLNVDSYVRCQYQIQFFTIFLDSL